eukprot:1775121-Amphidinium_carterae.1
MAVVEAPESTTNSTSWVLDVIPKSRLFIVGFGMDFDLAPVTADVHLHGAVEATALGVVLSHVAVETTALGAGACTEVLVARTADLILL